VAGEKDAGCAPDLGPAYTLTTLATFCAEVSAGEQHLNHDKAASTAFLCGEALTDDDLPHLPATIGNFGPPESCTHGDLAAHLHAFETSIALGRIAFDPSAAEACRADGQRSDGGSPIASSTMLIPDCAHAIVGLVPIGGACSAHEECADGYCKPGGIDTCDGLCVAPLSPGDLCEPRRDICRALSDCKQASDGRWRCVARAERGEVCGGVVTCDNGLACVNGRCGDPRPAPRAGEPCLASNPPCENRCLACGSGGLCTPRGNSGAACATDEDCLDALYCTKDRTCAMRPRRGEPCVLRGTEEGNCLYADDLCRDGTCQEAPAICTPASPTGPIATKGAGEACTSDMECTTGLCTENDRICATPCANGCIGNFLSYYAYLLFFAIVFRAKQKRSC
jgi:hypothetical protein